MSRLPNPEFWAGKKVFLTGQTGFKGSWAALWLGEMGAHVTAFSLPPEEGDTHFVSANIAARINSHFGDLRNYDELNTHIARSQPDVVLHMAAQALVRRSVRDPLGTFETNVNGTGNLLKAIKAHAPNAVTLVVTSDKVYRNDDLGRAFIESDPLGGKDPYSASKAACEILVHSWAKTYAVEKLATVRGGNVIGGGDFSEDRIVPDIVRAVQTNKSLALRHPEATRPWQHVLDCLTGYFVYMEELSGELKDRSLNIGPTIDNVISVSEVADRLQTILGGPKWHHEPDPNSVEAKLLSIDANRARAALGWDDRLTGDALFSWTAKWYDAFLKGEDMEQVSLNQIREYAGG